MSEFKLPNLGDGVAQGDVLKVLVKVGDTLAVDQSVLELETDKATIEVPSDVAGKVTAINVKAGDKVKPGQAVLTLENGAGAKAAEKPKQEAAPASEERQASASARENAGELRRDLAEAASGREGGPQAPQEAEAPQAAERPKASVTNISSARP